MPKTSGIIVPFNVAAPRGWWNVRFQAGALTIDDVAHVPLMFEHGATHAVIGVMTDVEETAEGIVATFDIDDTPDGVRAAAELVAGSRTGFSIGVEYDEETMGAIVDALWDWDAEETPTVDASGRIREVSHVAVPAFDGARASYEPDPEPAEQTAGEN